MYGASTTTYKLAIDSYFNDSPYDDNNNNGVLDYITFNGVEDTNDNGILDAYDINGDGVTDRDEDDGLGGLPPADDGDGIIDGDHVVKVGASYSWNEELSPFDIDDDGKVELPLNKIASIPDDEYTRHQVLKHTITHEMGHSAGIREHCDDRTCLMFKLSNNWKRDGHFCNRCRRLIKIHNN